MVAGYVQPWNCSKVSILGSRLNSRSSNWILVYQEKISVSRWVTFIVSVGFSVTFLTDGQKTRHD